MGHGGRWGVFAEDVSDVIAGHLPVLLQQGHMLSSAEVEVLGEDGAAPVSARCVAIVHPDDPGITLRTMALAVRVGDADSLEMWSAFPCCMRGDSCELTVVSVREDCRGIEGIVTAAVDDGPELTFFDPLFFTTTAYRPGARVRVALAALAYVAESAPDQAIQITDPEQIRAMLTGSGEDPADPSPLTIHTAGMSAWFPRDEGLGDDGEFQSRIHEVHVTACLGMEVHVLGISLARLGDRDIRCRLYVPRSTLRGGFVPRVGDDVRGVAWLQGRLLP
jgi:hypothetical protein